MRIKYIASIALIALGSILALKGAIDGDQSLINAGIGGIFLGIVVLSFATSEYIKYDALEAVLTPYTELCKKLLKTLDLKNKAVYIPPYDNMPDGGVFIPLHEDFDIDLAKLDENVMFLTDVGREKEMGLLITPLGKELMKMYESYSEMDFSGAGVGVVEGAPVLKALGLARSITIEEDNERIKVYLEGVVLDTCSKDCEQIACPICSSILLAIAKSLQELIQVEKLEVKERYIEISARKIGGIDRWM
ncbi:hypothetical protein Asulf_01044 [Archaeoglobus sulfaticallidus PM70-1]|uniref:DUF7982 domain-containing protein n=1 Tax=Archaeoglobus sulfaticallidus PM70-1 TaxID=387631 RepID=N0BLH8_9EURY|nr:hypothetical protein [Archaeoglobus sulfaticallidus]AGK61045.1 hypothetical protein Asulf_01044 [Archaeoglobus sulfaticallidus PM70-1]